MAEKPTTIKDRFLKYDTQRSEILRRNRQCAALTIPSLLPPEGHTEQDPLTTPWQSLGARGTNNLASKLLLALFPPNSPFFRLVVDDFTLEELGSGQERAEVEKGLNKIERAVINWIETKAIRVPVFSLLKHLIVTGNSLAYLPDKGGMKLYRLDQYIVKRDPVGNVIEIIVREMVHPVTLPQNIRDNIKSDPQNPEQKVDVYTQILRQEKTWKVTQEVSGIKIPESSGEYPLDKSPWLALRWSVVDGEDYGRGLVEEYLGDLISLEGLRKAIVEGSAACAKLVFLVDPNGTTRREKIAKSKNGDIIEGREEDVAVLQMNKFPDFQVPQAEEAKLTQELSYAFLLMNAIQRDAERVTAEEIRELVKEIEDSLGGVYSVLSQDLQLPLVKLIMFQMQKQNKLPELPEEIVEPMIVTGLEALGRGNDLNKLGVFLDFIEKLGEEAKAYLSAGDVLTRIGTALGIDTNGMVKSEEEVQQANQSAMMAQAMQASAPGATQEIVKGVMNGQGQGFQQAGQAPTAAPSGG